MISFFKKYPLPFFLLLYLFGAIVLFPYFKFYIDPDGISYIGIAKKYAAGNFHDAINGFWSPMISWLIAILLRLNHAPIIAAKVAGIIIGFFTLITIYILSKRFELPAWINNLFLLAMVILLLNYGSGDVAVDLLLLPFLSLYFFFIFKKDFFQKPRYSAWCGALGALAYFAKQYAFPFFILHFFILNLIHFFRESQPQKNQMLFKNLIVGYFTFFLVSGSWIFLISSKYEQLTLGTTGKINYSQALNNENRSISPDIGYFLEPPNATAIDWSEDPFYVQGKYITPIDVPRAFLKLVWETVKTAANIFIQISWLTYVVIIASFIFIFLQTRKHNHNFFLYSMATIIIYPLGYLLIHIEERFLWIVVILLILNGLYLLQQFFLWKKTNPFISKMIVFVFLFSFLFLPTKSMFKRANHYDYLFKVAGQLKNKYHIQGKVFQIRDFGSMQYVCFLLDNSFCPIKNPSYPTDGKPFDWNEPPPEEKLSEGIIKYFFDWHWDGKPLPSLYGFEEITKGKIFGVKIYKLNNQP